MTTQLPTQQGGEVDDGGPVFPGFRENDWFGMTVRDYSAGEALAGFLACGEAHAEGTEFVTARAAYKMADAMIAARNAS